MPTMKAKPEWLRAAFKSPATRVDREANVLRGMVVAQLGPFKSPGRGSFDKESLSMIVSLANSKSGGLKSRFTHPDMSSDGLGKFLGRVRDNRMDTALDERTGKIVPAVRGDLHFDKTSLDTPPEGGKPLGLYVMDLAESDPAALSSSIVVEPDKFIEDGKGGLVKLGDGEDAPEGVTPLWRPRVLHASDIVDTGDAVDGLLSADLDIERLPLSVLWKGSQLLDAVFLDQSRDVIEERLKAYIERYLNRKFGEPAPAGPTPILDSRRLKMDEMKVLVRKLTEAA
jgi:hypothetical protein